MNPASLISSLQSDALAREIEQQLKDETGSVIAAAECDVRAALAQARATARSRMRAAIKALRLEGARRLTRARGQLETERRAQAQRQAAQAVSETLPLLRDRLEARWRDTHERRQWTGALAQLCATRLRPGAWLVEHPAGWNAGEQRDFATAIGAGDGIAVSFKADDALSAGLRIKADQAMLDATPKGLLADGRTVAAFLLDEIERQ